jgi:hypothetical protein
MIDVMEDVGNHWEDVGNIRENVECHLDYWNDVIVTDRTWSDWNDYGYDEQDLWSDRDDMASD